MAKDKPKGQDVETMNTEQITSMIRALRDRIRTATAAERPALREELSEIEPALERAAIRETAAREAAMRAEYAQLTDRLVALGVLTNKAGARIQEIELSLERPLPTRDPAKLSALAAACAEAAMIISERKIVDDEARRVSDRLTELSRKIGG